MNIKFFVYLKAKNLHFPLLFFRLHYFAFRLRLLVFSNKKNYYRILQGKKSGERIFIAKMNRERKK